MERLIGLSKCTWSVLQYRIAYPGIPRGIDLSNQTAVVTGASRGTGREIAKHLALRGANVYVASRSVEEARTLSDEVQREAAGRQKPGSVQAFRLDLADLESVAACAQELRSRVERIDILVANAGIAGQPYRQSKQGHEMTFSVITLGHFLLVKKLEDVLVRSKARVVVVASMLHYLADDSSADYMYSRQIGLVGGWIAYCRAKLGKLWWAQELQRRHPELTVPTLHPGIVRTGILTFSTPVVDQIVALIKPLIAIKPAQGARTGLWCATSPEVKGNTLYHNVWGATQQSKEARDVQRAQRFYEDCERLCSGF